MIKVLAQEDDGENAVPTGCTNGVSVAAVQAFGSANLFVDLFGHALAGLWYLPVSL